MHRTRKAIAQGIEFARGGFYVGRHGISKQNVEKEQALTDGSGQTPLRAAVIGAGMISAEHLRFLRRNARARLVGVCDLSKVLARYAADTYGAESHYTDHLQMLEHAKPDVVHVLTPPHTHCKIAADCLKNGTHVIVEKPIASTNEEFRILSTMAQWQHRALTEDHNYRFNEQILEIESLVKTGVLGQIREVDIRMTLPITEKGGAFADENLPNACHRLPAGALHDLLPHLCYIALRFIPPVEDVAARWTKRSGHPLFEFDSLDAMVFGGGVHTRLRFASDQAPDCFTVIVRGAKGWVETDLYQPYFRLTIPRRAGKQLSPLSNQWVNGIAMAQSSVAGFLNKIRRKTPLEGMQTFLARTYAALCTGSELPVTHNDMDGTTRLMDALIAEENRV
jgi:predicted dehydrogenase